MHIVLVNRLGGLSLPRKSVVRLTDHPDMTLDVYRGRKTTTQQKQHSLCFHTGLLASEGAAFHLTLSLPKSRRQNFHLQIFKKCEVQAISY